MCRSIILAFSSKNSCVLKLKLKLHLSRKQPTRPRRDTLGKFVDLRDIIVRIIGIPVAYSGKICRVTGCYS